MALLSKKSSLRKEILARVSSLSKEERNRQSEIIQNSLLNSIAFKNAKHISVYLSLPKEVSTDHIVDSILMDGTKFCYVPDIVSSGESPSMKMLRLYSKDDLKTFEKKQLGVLSPSEKVERMDPICGPEGQGLDLIILPGVAFDPNGGRMGRGKGYYDRYIDQVFEYNRSIDKPIPLLIALAFDEQVIEEVPMSETDRRLDLILSPKLINQ